MALDETSTTNKIRLTNLCDDGRRAGASLHVEGAQLNIKLFDILVPLELDVHVLHGALIRTNEDMGHIERTRHVGVVGPLLHESVRGCEEELRTLPRIVDVAGLHDAKIEISLCGAVRGGNLQRCICLLLVFEPLIIPASDELHLLLLRGGLSQGTLHPSCVGTTTSDVDGCVLVGACACPTLIRATVHGLVDYHTINQKRFIVANRTGEIEGRCIANAALTIDSLQLWAKLSAVGSVGTKSVIKDGRSLACAHVGGGHGRGGGRGWKSDWRNRRSFATTAQKKWQRRERSKHVDLHHLGWMR